MRLARYRPKAAVRRPARRRIRVGVFLLIGLFGCDDNDLFYPRLSQADLCDDLENSIVHARDVLERRHAERSFVEQCIRSDSADPDEEGKQRPKKDGDGGGEIGE